jgi:hypothetical protein
MDGFEDNVVTAMHQGMTRDSSRDGRLGDGRQLMLTARLATQ